MKAKRILIVDDQPDTLDLYKAILAKEGHYVEAASSGAEALSRLESGRFDLVLLDVFMPGMSGDQVAAVIRANPKLRHMKVAFLSIAELATTGKELIAKYSAADYIQKPVALKEFLSKLRRLVG